MYLSHKHVVIMLNILGCISLICHRAEISPPNIMLQIDGYFETHEIFAIAAETSFIFCSK